MSKKKTLKECASALIADAYQVKPVEFAMRAYLWDGHDLGIEYQMRDFVMLMPDDSLELWYTTGGHPLETDSKHPISLKQYFEWLQEAPEQITRAVY